MNSYIYNILFIIFILIISFIGVVISFNLLHSYIMNFILLFTPLTVLFLYIKIKLNNMFIIISNNEDIIIDEPNTKSYFYKVIYNILDLKNIINKNTINNNELHKTKSELIFKEMTIGLIIYNNKNKIIDCNKHILEIYGYTYNEFINLNLSDIQIDEKYHIKKNGIIFPIKSNSKKINRKYSLITVEDISEKEKELQILKDLYHIAKVGYWQKDIIKNETILSNETYKIYELEYNNDIDTENLHTMFIHPDDITNFKKYIENLKNNKNAQLEYRIIINNKIKHIITVGRTITDKNKNPLYYYGITQDITDIKNQKLYYERMFDNSLVGMWKSDKINNKCIISDVNLKIMNILEYMNKDILINKDLFDVINIPLKQKDFIRNTLTEHGELNNYLLSNVLIKTGKIKHFIISLKLFNDGHIEGILLDNTKQINMEIKLNNSLESYKSVFDTLTNSITILNKELVFIDVNKGSEAMYGYNKNEIIGKTLMDLSALEDNESKLFIQNKLLDCYNNNNNHSFEFYSKRKNGDVFPKHVQIYKAKYFGSDVIISFAQDISNLKIAERRLVESKDNYNRLLDSAPMGIVSCDLDGNIDYINMKTLDLLGSPSIDKSKKVNIFTFTKLVESGISDKFKLAIDSDTNVYHEGYYTSKWNKTVYYRFYISTLKKDNQIYGAIGMVEDFTERKDILDKLRDQKLELIESNEILENFAYTTSHDLKTPLRGINTFLDKINNRLLLLDKNDEKLKIYIDIVKKSVKQMNSIITDTLNYSKISKNNLELKENSLYNCINDSIDIIKQTQQKFHIINKIEKDFILNFDYDSLERVFINLISNAIKFNSKDKVIIEIGFNKLKKYIYIKDNGDGIEEEYFDKIFNLFQRLHSSDIEGNGLGLAIVKKVIQRHKWEIKITSKLKIGTTFKIYIT